jgi:katanin p60 ATPase-containing subunit A1
MSHVLETDLLAQIELARENARLSNYDSSIRCYSSALDAAAAASANTQPDLLAKWTNLTKDIKAEQASITRLKDIFATILSKLNADDDSDPTLEDGRSPLNRNDDILDLPPTHKARGRDRRPALNGLRPPQSAKSKGLPEFNVIPIKPIVRPDKDPPRKRRNTTPPPPAAKPDKLPLPNLNPLEQQIVEMGILVREPNVSWDSIAGLSQVKRLLRQNLVFLPMRPDISRGLLAPWKSVLFYGPPGTGKTFMAKAVATECRRTFFNITSAAISSKWHGESEKLVQYVFDLAEQMAPSTIFFDEIDSVASQRGNANENDVSRRMKAQLLTKLEGIDSISDNQNVFVLAATNFPWDLDEALLRRFQKRIYIPLPDADARAEILKMSMGDMVDEDSFAIREWAERLDGYSCADIANLCRDAAQMVFEARVENLDPDEWMAMSAEAARVIIRDQDFAGAVAARKSSVDQNTINRYEDWRSSKGAE